MFGLLTTILKEQAMSTRAQIGIYESIDLKQAPIALIYRHQDGFPTGNGGVCPALAAIVPAIAGRRGHYDAPYLAAQLLHTLIQQHDGGSSGLGYGLDHHLHGDIRFYYAVTPAGMHCFDARNVSDLSELGKPMFFSAWTEPERVRAIEEDIRVLEDQLTVKKLEFEGMKRKQLKRGR